MGQTKPRNICVAILAAGQSLRFGDADKLVQPLGGTMLGLHISATLTGLNCAHRLVVTSAADHPCAEGWREAGFAVVVNENAAGGLGTSVALAARHAAIAGADALMICLADMPFVPLGGLKRLVEMFETQTDTPIIASCSGSAASPPAIFDKALFPQLSLLTGQDGARGLLTNAETLPIAAEHLADIDTVAELLVAGGSLL